MIKRRAARILALGIFVGGGLVEATAGWAAGTGVGGAEDGLERIVGEMRSGEFGVREGASRELVEMGPGVLKGLKELIAREKDPEVTARLRAAYEQIEEREAMDPRRVTLDVKEMPLAEVMKEIRRQVRGERAGKWEEGEITLTPAAEKLPATVTLKVVREPALKVLGAVAKQAGLTVTWEQSRMWLDVGKTGVCEVVEPAVAGVQGVRARREKRPVFEAGSDIAVRIEPVLKLDVMAWHVNPGVRMEDTFKVVRAVDELGNEVKMKAGGSEGGATATCFHLEMAETPGKRLASVSGELAFTQVIHQEDFVLPTDGSWKEIMGIRARAVKMELEGEVLKFRMEVEAKGMTEEAFETFAESWRQLPDFLQWNSAKGERLWLAPAYLSPVDRKRHAVAMEGSSGVRKEYLGAIKTVQVTLRMPTQLKRVMGKVELKDVEIPEQEK